MKEAVAATGATASIVFVPPPFAADAIMEAADAGIQHCVCITDGIPTQDMMRVKRYMLRYRSHSRMRLTGPNCAGTITPGAALLGIMPGHIYLPGRVGIIGRSGTLGYEAASQLKELGIGVSTSVGIGGDPVNGSSFRDILELFEADDETDAVVMIGEIGGGQEARRRGVRARPHDQAGRRLHRRPRCPQGPPDGTCGRHRVCRRRVGAGEGGDPARLRDHRRPEPLEHGRHHGRRARQTAGRTGAAMTVGLSEREAWSTILQRVSLTDGDRILVTRAGTGSLGGLTQLLWWDPSVRIVLVARNETSSGSTAYVDDVRRAIELTGSDALLVDASAWSMSC